MASHDLERRRIWRLTGLGAAPRVGKAVAAPIRTDIEPTL